MQEEISKIFLEKISGTTDLIEEKFNMNRIMVLETEIRTKDEKIMELNS